MSEQQEKHLQRQMAAALARDCDANFERFVLTYQHRIYAFCVGLTKDRTAAQEIAQDTFLRAYTALKKYDAKRVRDLSLRGWLYQIALNLTKNSKRRKRLDAVEFEKAGKVASTQNVAQEIEQAELARTVRAGVGNLPARMRAAVMLRYLEDLSYDEIASITGQPQGTIKSNVHRGLAILKKELHHVNL